MGDGSGSGDGARTGRERKALLRAKREAEGLAQVSGWVPKERRAYAREVLAAVAQGANSLPPDPGQAEELEAARTEAAAARMAEAFLRAALADAERQAELTEAVLGAVRAEAGALRDAAHRAGQDAQGRAAEAAAALARAEAAERGREEAARELAAVRAEAEAAQGRERAAEERADALGGELAGIRGRLGRGGWRGVLLRLAGAAPGASPRPGERG